MFTASGGNQPSYPPSFASTITQEPAQLRWNSETELHSVSKSLLRLQKYTLILGIVTTNALLIWSAWTYSDYYYIFLPILCANTFLQAIMILCIVGHAAYSQLVSYWKDLDAKTTPNEPEKMVMVLPCYNETREEIEKSLDSLVAQKNIENHPKLIFVIVDGNAKGPGMEKTTQEHLLHDILPPTIRTTFTNGYRARDGLFMPVTIQSGTYAGVPYILLAKRYNQGKRDSLCFIRSFLFHYHRRSVGVETMFHPELFGHLAGLLAAAGLESVDYLVGMDADTVFDEECVWEMVRSIRRAGKGVVGVCGHVCVAFEGRGWGFWDLYQSLEYSLTQGLRRMFQARITGKVNCLPGIYFPYPPGKVSG
jgi:chitin synthase